MTTRPSSAEVQLRAIRAHEGSQARAWEELAYQLRPAVGTGHIETRKTRAPDAGVEWYETYADGHQEGFQAKFHASLEDALGGMRESVEAVCAKRPRLTKLIFVVPYDFTDSGASRSTSDQDRWEAAVARWKAGISGAERIEFCTIRAGDITSKLTLKEHAGRREYWFGGLDITDDWLSQRFAEALHVAGERYTPEADTISAVNLSIDAVVQGPTFMGELESHVARAGIACRRDPGMWGENAPSVAVLVDELELIRELSFDGLGSTVPNVTPDLSRLAAIVVELLDFAEHASADLRDYERRNIGNAVSELVALSAVTTGREAEVMMSQRFALVGPAGQGKTHALMAAVEGCLSRGAPALAILGQRLSDKSWWPAIAESLDGMQVTSDVFLQALDSRAEASNCRALIVIDALNESQSPQRWRHELPALLEQFQRYPHLALIVSYRTDYRDVVGAPASLLEIRHPGFTGYEVSAVEAYCRMFGITIPSKDLFEPAFSSPLFLRMYCKVVATDRHAVIETPTRSNLFQRFAGAVGGEVTRKLELSPSSKIVMDAVALIADQILRNDGKPIPRAMAEQEVDSLLPGRKWPNTLFQQLASEGLIELRPSYRGVETVAFPFQAYSEHLLASRLLLSVEEDLRNNQSTTLNNDLRLAGSSGLLASRVSEAPWSWRSMAIMLPENEEIELVDILPNLADDLRLREATSESLKDRAASAFGPRAVELLHERFVSDFEDGVELALSLAPREGHPGNADWLHSQLSDLRMADRDSTWSIHAFQTDQDSDAYRRLTNWAERLGPAAGDEEVRLASIALMWLLTSSNRFLRDGASKTLVVLMSSHLSIAAVLIGMARAVDDPYVQERVLTCTYGAVLVGGDVDLSGTGAVMAAVSSWQQSGLPTDVLARDSVRGIATWCANRGLLPEASLGSFSPPYESMPPEEPPTRENLEAAFGVVRDEEGQYSEWRAYSILSSCLDWMGDFNKYVVKSDVDFFSWYPISSPVPPSRIHKDPLAEVGADWAGRWIANRAIALGWTVARFEDFERNHDLRRGREGHKAERIGKKYQWIAHRELLAKLADNFHPAEHSWSAKPLVYEGPWAWYGRDFDPTLPPSIKTNDSQVCRITEDREAAWGALLSPDMDTDALPDAWTSMTSDLPKARDMFSSIDPSGREWVAIQRYSTWDRDNSKRTGISKRERDVFFLQFSWLVPNGQGKPLYDFIKQKGLAGRWMPETRRTHQQYLGEAWSAPIVSVAEADFDEHDFPEELLKVGIRPRAAVENYLWEGGTLDCSIDQSVDFYAPTPELLGSAQWVGHKAAWSVDGQVVARAINYPDYQNGQDMLLVDAHWLTSRLQDLNMDMVIGTLSERHATATEEFDSASMAFSDVHYLRLVTSEAATGEEVGPISKVRSLLGKDTENEMRHPEQLPNEYFDLISKYITQDPE